MKKICELQGIQIKNNRITSLGDIVYYVDEHNNITPMYILKSVYITRNCMSFYLIRKINVIKYRKTIQYVKFFYIPNLKHIVDIQLTGRANSSNMRFQIFTTIEGAKEFIHNKKTQRTFAKLKVGDTIYVTKPSQQKVFEHKITAIDKVFNFKTNKYTTLKIQTKDCMFASNYGQHLTKWITNGIDENTSNINEEVFTTKEEAQNRLNELIKN